MNKLNVLRARHVLVLALAGLLSACGGEDPQTPVVGTPGGSAPSLSSFTITPGTLRINETARATWNVTGTNGATNPCTLTREAGNGVAAETSSQPATTVTSTVGDTEGVVITAPATAGDYLYTFTCHGPGGNDASVTKLVKVNPPRPTVDLIAAGDTSGGAAADDSSTIAVGATDSLTWTSTDASSCTATGPAGWSGSKDPVNTTDPVVVGPFPSDRTLTYTLTCVNSAGESDDDTVTLVVGTGVGAPVVSVDLAPTLATAMGAGSSALSVQTGQPAFIGWTTQNATSCTYTSPTGTITLSAPQFNPTDRFQVGPFATAGARDFTVSCSNGAGASAPTSSATATLTVTAAPIPVVDCGVTGLPTTALVAPIGVAATGNITNCIPGACSVAGTPALLTPDLTDFATMSINLGLDGTLGLGDALGLNSTPSLSVMSALAIPPGRKVGFMVSSGPGAIPLVGLNLVQNIVVSTLAADGTTVVESADPDGGVELEVLTLDLGNILLGSPQRSFISFTTTAASRGARLQFNSALAAVLSDLRVYSACVSQ